MIKCIVEISEMFGRKYYVKIYCRSELDYYVISISDLDILWKLFTIVILSLGH